MNDNWLHYASPRIAGKIWRPTFESLMCGLTEAEAAKWVRVRGLDITFRVVERDGAGLEVTTDYVFNRANIAVDQGIVFRFVNWG